MNHSSNIGKLSKQSIREPPGARCALKNRILHICSRDAPRELPREQRDVTSANGNEVLRATVQWPHTDDIDMLPCQHDAQTTFAKLQKQNTYFQNNDSFILKILLELLTLSKL